MMDNSEMETKQKDDIKADIQLLLECLEYQKGNTSAMKQAMVTLSSAICDSGSPGAQDIFRNAGGIQKVLNIVTGSKTDEIVEVGLFCLGNAVEKNVYSQKLLSTASFFNFLHCILSSSVSTALRKRQMAAFVLLCLVSNNSFGQNMARQSSCLHDVLSLIRTTLSKNGESSRGRMIELWATLVRAACVCVNNPVNEDNQRICSTLFPYLLNVLGSQEDERVLKPVLSLMCLAVSYNGQNQGKLTRCGGMQILLKKLKSLLSDGKESLQQQTIIQLICTLDVCLTENEGNSKIFGDLGGISLVLNLMQRPGLSSHDKIQLVLILAHAVDANVSNKEYISRENGIKILIQQMTESSDEELTKTTKYLLHMCVSSDKSDVDEEYEPAGDAFAAKLDQMKRHSDLEILQKLNDLDNKLKDIKGRDLDVNRNQFENVNSFEKSEICLSDISGMHLQQSVSRAASVCSSNSVDCRHRCPTPREKTLMDELIKEKMEKEKLEKLNQLLQEDVVTSRAALAEKQKSKSGNFQCKSKQSEKADRGDYHSFSNQSDTNSHTMSKVERDYLISKMKDSYAKDNTFNAVHQNFQEMGSMDPKFNSVIGKDMFPVGLNGDIRLNTELRQNNNVLYAYPVYEKPTLGENERRNYLPSVYNGKGTIDEANYTSMPVSLPDDNSCDQISAILEQEGSNLVHEKGKSSVINNLQNGSASAKTVITSTAETINDLAKSNMREQNQNMNVKFKTTSELVNRNNSSMTRSRNAEIQCGTPYVNTETTNTGHTNSHVNESSQTNFPNRPNNQKRKLIDTSTGPTSATGPSSTFTTALNTGPSSSKTTMTTKSNTETSPASRKNRVQLNETGRVTSPMKVAKVVVCDVVSSTGSKLSSIVKSNTTEKDGISYQKVGKPSKQTDETFVKPIAAPPRKKVRMTPLMGTQKVLNNCRVDVRKTSTTTQPSDFSDLESEFDQELVKILKKATNKKAAPVEANQSMMYGRIKSQNNTRKLDRHLGNGRHDATHAWKATPCTPENQHTVPARPAFSDCGMRRFNVFESPHSARSVDCLLKNSLNDTGLHTPADMKQRSPNSIDSDIEACRSNSDESEDDAKSLNITTTALRSHKRQTHPSKLCPGCHYCTDENGNPLTSRTYIRTLEKHPGTCAHHRQLRVYTRHFIKTKKREMEKRRRKSRRLLNFKDLSPEKLKSNSFDYQPSECDVDQLTPPCKDDSSFFKFKTRKTRRQRLPYTIEEENNLIEGVKKIGKHWNQILATYNFHPSRTNVDLMDKFKRMVAADSGLSEINSTKPRRYSKPFSLCEERRLRKGVKMFGHNWKSILQAYQFEKDRTSEELRNRWRVMQKHMELS